MALINGACTRHINLRHERDGALLRGKFFQKITDDDNCAVSVLRYIHLNFITAVMTAASGLYLWSSHNVYLRRVHNLLLRLEHMEKILDGIGVELSSFDAWTRTPLPAFSYDAKAATSVVLPFAIRRQTAEK